MTAASITHELRFDQPPERVWQALTSSAALERWLMPNDFEPRVGHQFTFTTTPMPAFGFDGIAHCEVTECDAPRLLAYTWNGGHLRSLVTYRLEPDGDGARPSFEHSGFDLSDPAQEGAYNGMQGWGPGLDQSLRREIDARAATEA